MVRTFIRNFRQKICILLAVVSIFSVSLAAYTKKELESFWIKVSYNQVDFYQPALQASLQEIYNVDNTIQIAAFSLFENLASKILCREQVLDTACAGLRDCNKNKIISLKIFVVLVQQDLYFFKAVDAALQCLGSADYTVRQAALDVFLALIKKGQYYQEIFKVAKLYLSDEQYSIRKTILEIFEVLVLRGLYCDQIFSMAQKYLKDHQAEIKELAFRVLNALVVRGKYHQQAFVFAHEELDSNASNISCEAREVLATLTINGHRDKRHDDLWTEAFTLSKSLVVCPKIVSAYAPSIQRAELGIRESETHVKNTTLDFFINLVCEGKLDSYSEAIRVAELGSKDLYRDIREKSFELFFVLVSKKQAYTEALKAVLQVLKKGPHSNSFDSLDSSLNAENEKVVQVAIKLLINLVMQGQAYDEALLITAQWKHLDLLISLVEQGQGYELAMEAIKQECGEGIFIKAGVNRLLSTLVYKGQLSQNERDELIRGKQVLLMPVSAQPPKKPFTF